MPTFAWQLFQCVHHKKEGQGEDGNRLKEKNNTICHFQLLWRGFLFLHLKLILFTLVRAFHFHHLSTIRLHLLFILLAKSNPHLGPSASSTCYNRISSLSIKFFILVYRLVDISCLVTNSTRTFRIARTGLISVAINDSEIILLASSMLHPFQIIFCYK